MFAGPFLGAGAEELWGLRGAYYVSLAAMIGAAVIVKSRTLSWAPVRSGRKHLAFRDPRRTARS
jgi:hypothetical protein